MRPSSSLIVSLIVLRLLLCRAYGTRLDIFGIKSPPSTFQQTDSRSNNNSNNDIITKEGAKKNGLGRIEKIEVVCEDGDHCTSKGNNRKLLTITTVSTSIAKTIQEKWESGRNKVDMRREALGDNNNVSWPSQMSSTINDAEEEEEEVTPNKYEDLIDMAQMDYSPAKRRPPIHN